MQINNEHTLQRDQWMKVASSMQTGKWRCDFFCHFCYANYFDEELQDLCLSFENQWENWEGCLKGGGGSTILTIPFEIQKHTCAHTHNHRHTITHAQTHTPGECTSSLWLRPSPLASSCLALCSVFNGQAYRSYSSFSLDSDSPQPRFICPA